jgi:alpha-D-xyloside xylohydrolase
VYVKEGSIIPTGPELQYTSEKPADPLTLYVYTGKNGAFDLYEDEGVNYNYEQGQSSLISFKYNEDSSTLTIANREGSFKGMLEKRTIQIGWVKKDKTIGIDAIKPHQTISYEGKEVVVKMN